MLTSYCLKQPFNHISLFNENFHISDFFLLMKKIMIKLTFIQILGNSLYPFKSKMHVGDLILKLNIVHFLHKSSQIKR